LTSIHTTSKSERTKSGTSKLLASHSKKSLKMWLNRASQPVVTFPRRKAHLDFSIVFPYLPEETCFQQAGSSAVEGTSQAVLGSSHHQKVPASLPLFLKVKKIPALLYVGKGPSMNFDVFPQPTGLGHRSQITKRPVLRPFSYTDRLGLLAFWLSCMKVLCTFKYHILVLNTAIFRSSKSRHFFRKKIFSKA